MRVRERHRRELWLQLLPQTIHAKAITSVSDVVKQDHPVVSDDVLPRFVVVANGYIGVTPVDMEEIHRSLAEARASLV